MQQNRKEGCSKEKRLPHFQIKLLQTRGRESGTGLNSDETGTDFFSSRTPKLHVPIGANEFKIELSLMGVQVWGGGGGGSCEVKVDH